jgi:hypothetical protein
MSSPFMDAHIVDGLAATSIVASQGIATHQPQSVPNQNVQKAFKDYKWYNSYSVPLELQCGINRLELPTDLQIIQDSSDTCCVSHCHEVPSDLTISAQVSFIVTVEIINVPKEEVVIQLYALCFLGSLSTNAIAPRDHQHTFRYFRRIPQRCIVGSCYYFSCSYSVSALPYFQSEWSMVNS